ncbi:MAG TPA: peptidoglycan-binding protein [Candidatus Binatia bacterium]|jgi:predicted chitinase|nr:peptidoglycan-binding protein [Candidatus Binatia bacterium]
MTTGTIRRGARGTNVESFQRFLITQGLLAATDAGGRPTATGVADAPTIDAIRAFQLRYGIAPAQGVAGPATQTKARSLGWADGTPAEAAVSSAISLDALRAAFRKMPAADVDTIARDGSAWFAAADLSNPERQACFLANVCVESGEGAYFREAGYVPPLAALRYFVQTYAAKPSIIPPDVLPRARAVLAAADQAGAQAVIDRCYVGRAALQVTHRANYETLVPVLGQDFVAEPRLLEQPRWAIAAGAVWWRDNGANVHADQATSADGPGFRKVCNLVNRGRATATGRPNGWTERQAAFRRIYPLLRTPTEMPAPVHARAVPAGSPASSVLERGATGPAVEALQLRLAGFRGTLWDGEYGPGTELQVVTFQRDYMRVATPSGAVDAATVEALRRFAAEYPVDFTALRCPCGRCSGFGLGRFTGEYQAGMPRTEAYHRREYPGIHRAILHAMRAAAFHASRAGHGRAVVNSGYRCWFDNLAHGRTSTNHMGKAIDIDFDLAPGEDKRADRDRCDKVRGLLVETGNFQVGWSGANRKALEPSEIAPTWVHMDVRAYAPRYLEDRFFVRSADELDAI